MAIAKTVFHVASLRGPRGFVGPAGPGWVKGNLPQNTNLNSFREPGLYVIPSVEWAATITGLPDTYPGIVIIEADPASSAVLCKQTFSTYRIAGDPYRAAIYDRLSVAAGIMASWTRRQIEHGNAATGLDLNTITEGKVSIPGPTNTSLVNGPPDAAPGFVITYGVSNFAIMKAQLYFEYGPEGRMLVRTTADIGGGYGAWRDLTAAGGAGAAPLFGAGTPNEMRIQAFKNAYPRVSTANKGAVVFRYDHGLTNSKSGILPIHVAAGIPYYVAMNSRNWGIAENSGATQADAKAWLASGLGTFGNHCADHNDKTTAAGIHDTVVAGRTELEAQLATTIHGFTVPGVGGTMFGGFGAGTLDSYASTYMGEVILANHAIASGTVGDVQRPLDGLVRQGGKHYTWESATFAQVKTQIDAAVAGKTALTLMAHPSNLGGVGFFDAALVQQVVDYVKSLIDTGQLANIDYYQSHHATL